MLSLSDFYGLITMICTVVMAVLALITLIIEIVIHINPNKKQK